MWASDGGGDSSFSNKNIIFEASLTLEGGSFLAVSSILMVFLIFLLPMQNHEFVTEEMTASSLSKETFSEYRFKPFKKVFTPKNVQNL